ncbi:MAG: DUF4236 domain-containing protein [Bacteroidaceae bacterium]|nr:DUF4236 domain-containing protein [Bacteroidaceae bacterium]
MAWNYRKRVKVAPGVFMNISKKGISTTIGVRGASMTFGKNGTYMNTGIPGTGYYNRRRISGGVHKAPKPVMQSSTPPSYIKAIAVWLMSILCPFCILMGIDTGNSLFWIGAVLFGIVIFALAITDRKSKAEPNKNQQVFLDEAKSALGNATNPTLRRILESFIKSYEAIDEIDDEEKIIEKLKEKPEKNADIIKEHEHTLTKLKERLDSVQYDVDAELDEAQLKAYGKICEAFENLQDCEKVWLITSQQANTQIKSSASTSVVRQDGCIFSGVFNYLKSQFDIPAFEVSAGTLYLYPKFAILAQRPGSFQFVSYDNVTISYSIVRFNEEDGVPSDAERDGYTWRYINKNGGPDRRFADNRKIPVAIYGKLIIQYGKFTYTFHFSNYGKTKLFVQALADYKETIKEKAKGNDDSITNLMNRTPELNDHSNENLERPRSSHSNPTQKSKLDFNLALSSATKLYEELVALSNDKQVIDALDRYPEQLNAMKQLHISKIDDRVAVLGAMAAIKCFDKLGHANLNSDEGLVLCLFLSQILSPEIPHILEDEESMRSPEGIRLRQTTYDTFKNNVHISFNENNIVLIDLLRNEGVDDTTVNKFTVMLYRFARVIAEADENINKTEKEWLVNLLSFINPLYSLDERPKEDLSGVEAGERDPLLVDATELFIKNQSVSTSLIQRRFDVDYNRANRIIEQLEVLCIVGPIQDGKPREMLVYDIEEAKKIINKNGRKIAKKSKSTTSRKPLSIRQPSKGNAIKELTDLIGLESVKSEVENIYNLIKIQKVREEKGLKSSNISYHCVFTGNPGTGKTTVARLVAQIYKDLGILSKGHLVETDRSGLVAEYVGQTAVKTNKIIDSALDGVLFIDEAYSLVQGSQNDFGMEAISTLLKRMEDNRDRLVVILAGYSDEMKKFINANPGLQSRFNRYIHFEDYNAEDLVAIYGYNIKKYDYQLSEDGMNKLHKVLTAAVDNKDKNFGNARYIRNLFEKTIENQARRLASVSSLSEDVLTEIKDEDIPDYM